MKKLFFQILAALLLWTAVFALCLCFGAKGLTLYFEVPPDATGYSIRSDPEGIVNIAETELDDESMAVHFQAIRRGSTDVILYWEGVDPEGLYADEISMRLKVLPLGIVTDSITWNFTGWGYFTACISFFLLTTAVICFFSSQNERRKRFFSYRATAELGLAIFFLITSFFRVDMLLPFLRGENAGTVWSLLVGIIVSAQTFMRWTAVILAVFSLLTAVSNAVLMRFEGFRPSNMLGFAVAALLVGGAAFGIWMSYSLLTFPLRNMLLNVYAGLFAYFECLLAATVIHAFQAGRHEPDYDKDYVMILGCRIRPDGSLYPLIRGRVDRAIAFVRAQEAATGKKAVLVPSGGKGTDEPLTEAEAMARYIREQGIEELLVEDRSSTTLENLRFSRALIQSDAGQTSAPRVAFSTSSYHVYRGGILASEAGWNIDGMGSQTKWYFWPNAFLREFIGLLAASRFQQLAAVFVIALLSAGLTALVM
ncbi:MAG: YdcF family protein [Oscillospiraceae bacterium]|nr:YdcF family protein [Oscillospiraceae bacterium]